jgi:hypothetical protein
MVKPIFRSISGRSYGGLENILGQTVGIQEGTWLLPVKIRPVDGNKYPTRLSMLTTLDMTHPHRVEREFDRSILALPGPLPHS